MPSPVGHSLGGAIVGLALGTPSTISTLGTVGTLGTVVLAGVAPDLDFLWSRHNREIHSLGAAVVAGLVVLLWTRGRNPRLALAGLNPHAGENGAMGTEDGRIIAPAIDILRADGIEVAGPLPADTMFHARARSRYDAALAMYHDQALIPIKTLAFDHAVNVTLGLPFVRTSPDHDTAFDIAGTGKADPSSLIAALRLAARLAHTEGDRQRAPAAAVR